MFALHCRKPAQLWLSEFSAARRTAAGSATLSAWWGCKLPATTAKSAADCSHVWVASG